MEKSPSHEQKDNSFQIKKSYLVNRDYICACGKSYLSYPALFTHVKQKHNGKAPGEVIKPASKINLKRGRPKGIRNREGGGRLSADDFTKRLGEINTIEMEFLHYLIRIAKDLNDDTACNYAKFNLYYAYLGCNKQQYKVPVITPEFAFTHFLKELGQKIGERNTIMNSMVLLLGFFLQYIDQLYETREKLSDFSQNQSPKEMSLFANSFMTDYLPKMIKEYNLQGQYFFDIRNVQKTFEYLFIWLYRKEYVSQYLKIKSEGKAPNENNK